MPSSAPGNNRPPALTVQERCISKVYTNAARSMKREGLSLYDISSYTWARLNEHAEELEARYRKMFKVYAVATGPMVARAPAVELEEARA